jgi:regulator of sigma E protease
VSIAISILGLAALILLHEAGHFFTARAVGMRPRKFYLGFPPALAKVTRNGIEYGLGAIPLGGYVKIPGMHRPATSDLDAAVGPAVREHPELLAPLDRIKRRVAVGDFVGALDRLPELEQALHAHALSPAAQRAAERGLAELRDALGDDAYWRQRTWKRVAVIFAGPGTNILLAFALLAVAYMIGVPTNGTRIVQHVDKPSPAAHAGLRPGDEVIAVDTQPIASYRQMSRKIRGSHGKPLQLTVLRDGTIVTLPRAAPTLRDAPNGGKYYALGFRTEAETKRYGVGAATNKAGTDTWEATKALVSFLPRLFTGSGRKQVSSTVGIVDQSSQAVNEGFSFFLQILALISLSLAILNLLPLLPLDGGHIAFSLVEGLRGRAVGREVYERVSAVGIVLVMVIFFIGLSNDISRLGGG